MCVSVRVFCFVPSFQFFIFSNIFGRIPKKNPLLLERSHFYLVYIYKNETLFHLKIMHVGGIWFRWMSSRQQEWKRALLLLLPLPLLLPPPLPPLARTPSMAWSLARKSTLRAWVPRAAARLLCCRLRPRRGGLRWCSRLCVRWRGAE